MMRRWETSFNNRTAIITGGASGIGAAMGTVLAELGTNVILADIDGAAASAAASRIAGATHSTGTVLGRPVDVRDGKGLTALVDEVVDRHGSLDYFFNNAGISLGGPTHELTAAHWDLVLDVNLRGVVNGVLAAYPHMVRQGHGHLVNTASAAGLAAPPFVVPYATTKHAVVGLSMGLRPEAALHGVQVSVVCPGSIETPILDRLPPEGLPPTASSPVTARAYLASVGQKPFPAGRFARAALRSVARNEAIIVVPARARALWCLQRISPTLAGRIARILASKVTKDLIRPSEPTRGA
jgi:NAD(P)-dependent dehydrogenase (short-subunit alcohol dehydrogenase family)